MCNEDAALFGTLSQVVLQRCSDITDYVESECPNIIRYVNTIRDNFWPDWNEHIRHTPCSTLEFLGNFVSVNFF